MKRLLMNFGGVFLFGLVLLIAVQVHAQELPNVPHRFLDKTNVALFSAIATTRALDLHSTWAVRRAGWQEVELSNHLVDNKAEFIAFSAGMVAAHLGGCYLLHRAGHHRLERVVSMLHVGALSATVAKNYWLVRQ